MKTPEQKAEEFADLAFKVSCKSEDFEKRKDHDYWMGVRFGYLNGLSDRDAEVLDLKTQVEMFTAPYHIKQMLVTYSQLNDEEKDALNSLMESLKKIQRVKNKTPHPEAEIVGEKPRRSGEEI